MNNTEKSENIKRMLATLYRLQRENNISIRDIEFSFTDDKIKNKTSSVLRKANEDIYDIIDSLESELERITE